MQRVQNLKHPLRIGSPTFLGGGLEAGAKAGTLSAAHQLGAGEGGLWERAKFMPEAFNKGAALGAGFNTGLLSLANAPAAYQGIKDWGQTTLARRPFDAIGGVTKDFTGAAYRLSRGKDNPLKGMSDAEVGGMMFSDAVPPSTAFSALTEARPWDTVGGRHRPMLAEGLGLKTMQDGYPLRDPKLPGYLKWAGEADSTAGGALATEMREAGVEAPKHIRRGMERVFGPFPRNVDETIGALREDARDVWEGFYRDAYFTPAGNPISVPLSGGRGTWEERGKATGFMKMFKDEAIYRKIYEKAKAKRATNIAHKRPGTINNWDNYINGIDQHLPSWEMFLAGERYVPKSTWKDNAVIIKKAGWHRIKRGGQYKQDNNMYIVKQNKKNVDVKTLHDMRIAFDDMIALEQEAGRKATLTDAREMFDLRIKAVAPEEFGLADEAFKTRIGMREAGEAGRVATSREYSTPESIRAEYEGLATTQQQRMYLSGLAERLRSEGTTAEQILSDPTTRGNIEALFGGDEVKFGKFLQEVSSLSRSAEVRSAFGDPGIGGDPTIGQKFGGFMWTMFAKVPAYAFSKMFAGARDLTIVARNMEKSQNKIVGQEMTRLLSARSPEELVKVLRILDEEYRRTLPKDAAELRQIAALFMTAIAANERDLYTGAASGIQAAGRGLLGAF